jgi:hypothetical protein
VAAVSPAAALTATAGGFTPGAAAQGCGAFASKTSSHARASSAVSSGAIFEAAAAGGGVALSSYVAAADDSAAKLNWPDSSIWISNRASLPTYDSADGSWVFDRSMSQYFDAGARTFNPQSSGFTVTARVIVSPGHMKRILEALRDNLSKYEQAFGPIQKAEEPRGKIGLS